MLKGAIARRYAEAIFQIARRQNTVDRTLDDVQGIAQLFGQRTLSYLLREPKIPTQRKEKVLRDTLTPHILPTSLNLALLIVQRGLVEVMPNIATELEGLVLDYRNQVVAEVTTAAVMDKAEGAQVQQALEHKTGKQIIMHTRVDPEILGGIVARVGDQVIDGSIRNRLHVLQQQLLSGISSSSTDFAPEDFATGNDDGQGPARQGPARQGPALAPTYPTTPQSPAQAQEIER
ncbi:MAG: ATP synthase F1 subunit delta [Ktedonobacteraceae bacterium]|nr:ATP synthase F1 subunit delta [Ktedonobacteraceae bacterium]